MFSVSDDSLIIMMIMIIYQVVSLVNIFNQVGLVNLMSREPGKTAELCNK